MFNETWQREGQREVHGGLEDAAAKEITNRRDPMLFNFLLFERNIFIHVQHSRDVQEMGVGWRGGNPGGGVT